MPGNIKQLHEQIKAGNFLALARGITIVENELNGYESLLLGLHESRHAKVIGITGPPGAGKSTLVNALLRHWLKENKKIAVLAVDPSSPFNYGALLGDRIRMSDFYTNPNIFIRSLATRGALGGLNAKIIEITDVVKDAGFDIVLVETVGVGQSEVEIAGLADCTVVTLVPEAGDEVQTIKAGIMEIANIFVVNKAERPDAEGLYRNLRILAHEKANGADETPVIKTIATQDDGVAELANAIIKFLDGQKDMPEKRLHLMTDKCWHLIQAHKMKGIDAKRLRKELANAINKESFNLYAFVQGFLNQQ
ncbi:MAG: methylmalonyl Co-A mutase-associated GTPase MeaB [Flavipsychrobacter sp.]|nr:methylmalonyl Co-A mutase-associated GTPase MeaB [Flavipsychrobacter sp.]